MSILIVVPTALIYGIPTILSNCLDIQVHSVDLSNFLKSIMCLYLGISLVWILGIWKIAYWQIATQLNILFMFSLASGRSISLLTDGFPTIGYVFGILAEFGLGLYSMYQLRKYSIKLNPNQKVS